MKFSALSAALGALALVACADVSRDELMNGSGSARERRSQPIDAEDSDDSPTTPQGNGGASTDPGDDSPSNPANPSSPDAGSSTDASGDKDPSTQPDDGLDDFSRKVLARAKQWVDVKMPYCGGVNGGTDYLCDGTCVRTGAHSTPEWDPYRTDCSGFVSWSWSLPSPGRTTYGFAPYQTDITTVINVDDLLPGDALNNENHVILFGGWANAEHTQARLLEEYDCGQVAVDRIRSISKVSATQVSVPGGTFSAIRLDSRGM